MILGISSHPSVLSVYWETMYSCRTGRLMHADRERSSRCIAAQAAQIQSPKEPLVKTSGVRHAPVLFFLYAPEIVSLLQEWQHSQQCIHLCVALLDGTGA